MVSVVKNQEISHLIRICHRELQVPVHIKYSWFPMHGPENKSLETHTLVY
ncbi:hypothetical protein NC651_006485 [Populus alba x Populus x berolinensis]|nr:hypothetical protein NC651_006485 [Populus alba x Populus x berolinensis]